MRFFDLAGRCKVVHMEMTRRSFGLGLAASAFAFMRRPASALTVRGVRLGVQTYSFHDLRQGGLPAVEQITAAMKRLDLNVCELFSPDIEPFPLPRFSWVEWAPGSGSTTAAALEKLYSEEVHSPEFQKQREDLRAWRATTPDSYFDDIAGRFRSAGIEIYCLNFSFTPDMNDEEIEAGFRQAKALGAKYITSSSTLTTAKRVVPFAEKHGQAIGWHGHSNVKDPDQLSTPESFAKVMAMSKLYKVNLDIGHFTAAGFVPVEFIEQQHANITNLHIKDRKRNDGENMPLGRGDTDIAGVLRLLRDKHYDIPAFLEYEYRGKGSPEEELSVALAFERKILAS
jgi:sugar phosphate isomerase/epimerase